MTDAPIRSVLDEDHGSLPAASQPSVPTEGVIDYNAQSWADLRTCIGRIDADLPNFADWPITLPAGHWRTIVENSSSSALGGYEGPQGRSEPKPVDPTTAGEVEAVAWAWQEYDHPEDPWNYSETGPREREDHANLTPLVRQADHQATVSTLRAEIERLRESLGKIAKCEPFPGDPRKSYASGFDQGCGWASRVARQALGGSHE